MSTVKRSSTSTSSYVYDAAFISEVDLLTYSRLSATSIPASPPPPVVSILLPLHLHNTDSSQHADLIYKCGGIDKRTIEKFEKVRHLLPALLTSLLLALQILRCGNPDFISKPAPPKLQCPALPRCSRTATFGCPTFSDRAINAATCFHPSSFTMTTLTTATGSRRVGQRFLQVRMGFGQTQG